MTRKRFIKLLMSLNISRNDANVYADSLVDDQHSYFYALTKAVVNTTNLIKRFQKAALNAPVVQGGENQR